MRVRLRLDVLGELFAPAGAGVATERRPVSVRALFDFDERGCAVSASGSADGPARATVARRYTDAAAELRVGDGGQRTVLAADARDVLVARRGTMAVPHLAAGSLTDEEYDLLETPFDPLLLEGLLAAEQVGAGDAWQVAPDTAAGLLAIDTIESGGIDARLEQAADGAARVRISGIVDGAVDGAPTHIVIDGTFTCGARDVAPDDDATAARTPRFELWGPVDRVNVALRERRQASHVAPGLDVEARLAVTQTPIAADGFRPGPAAGTGGPETDAGQPPARRPGDGGPGVVWRRDAAGRFDLVRDARWRVVEDGPGGLVLRLVDRGALVAQCSITALEAAAVPSASPTVDELERDVRRSLAGQFERIEEAAAEAGPGGLRVVRVASSGTAAARPFSWIHYVLTAPEGPRLNVAFTFETPFQRRFGDADRQLVAGLRPTGRDRVARRPEPAAARGE